MSHEITAIDRQQGIAQAWHKLTEIVKKITLSDCWLSKWDVRKSPLFTEEGVKTDYCQLVATDNPSIRIGSPVHCETYQPISNADFLRIAQDAILGIKGAEVVSVGSYCGRGRVSVSVQLEQLASFEAAGRKFLPYLNFLNSHDMSAPFSVATSTTCVVCNNTFGMALQDTKGQLSGIRAAKEAASKEKVLKIRLKHTKNVGQRLEGIPEIVDGFLGAQAEFQAIMNTLGSETVRASDAKPLFTGFLMRPTLPSDVSKATKEELELSTRRANQIDRLGELFRNGPGNRGETMADAFSAVTDYYTHESAGGFDSIDKQLVSSEFGTGQIAKERAFNLFQSPSSVRDLIQTGNAVLAVN